VRVETPRSLRWRDVADTLARLGFRVAREEPQQTHMRRGSIHFVVRFYAREIGLTKEVCFHQDVGRPHRTLERSGELLRFRDELQPALMEQERVENLASESLDEHLKLVYCCPYYQVCPSFREDGFLCTYRFCDRSYCEEYQRLERA